MLILIAITIYMFYTKLDFIFFIFFTVWGLVLGSFKLKMRDSMRDSMRDRAHQHAIAKAPHRQAVQGLIVKTERTSMRNYTGMRNCIACIAEHVTC